MIDEKKLKEIVQEIEIAYSDIEDGIDNADAIAGELEDKIDIEIDWEDKNIDDAIADVIEDAKGKMETAQSELESYLGDARASLDYIDQAKKILQSLLLKPSPPVADKPEEST